MPSRPQRFDPRGRSRGEIERQTDHARGSSRQRGYDARWDRIAAAEKRLRPLCLGCEAVGLTAVTEVIDHIKPHRGDRELFWDPNNWQPACKWHHDVVKQQLERSWSAGQLSDDGLHLDSVAARALTLAQHPALIGIGRG